MIVIPNHERKSDTSRTKDATAAIMSAKVSLARSNAKGGNPPDATAGPAGAD
jgi:hypothetical protein